MPHFCVQTVSLLKVVSILFFAVSSSCWLMRCILYNNSELEASWN